MKTYLFDTLNRFRRFSENLDVKAALCNRPWQVFNDSGEKELYIFQEDGTLLITYSGRVTHSTWQYIAANKSIVISAGEQSYMVHPAFTDNVLFALQVDGTNECAFLIDENNSQGFAPQNYTALMEYFEEKERKLLEEERCRKQLALEEEHQKELGEEQRRKDSKDLKIEERVYEMYQNLICARKFKIDSLFGGCVVFGGLLCLAIYGVYRYGVPDDGVAALSFFVFCIVVGFVWGGICFLFCYLLSGIITNRRLKMAISSLMSEGFNTGKDDEELRIKKKIIRGMVELHNKTYRLFKLDLDKL